MRDTFAGLPVHTLTHPVGAASGLPAADSVAWGLECGYGADAAFPELWRGFLDTVDTERVTALVIGSWWDGDYTSLGPVVELIVADAARLPGLRALFLADVEGESCEISWLLMADITPVLEAFPLLEELGVRGGNTGDDALVLAPVRHTALRVLRFESGGLPGNVVRAVAASELPALEHLELWLGVEEYGGDSTVADLAPLLAGGRFPALRHLGLQNSELQDEIAAAVAAAPVVAQLTSLDLSMGVLSDEGAAALLGGQPLTHLTRLDLSHHYLSDAVMERVSSELGAAGVTVDLSEQESPEDEGDDEEWRYVAVSE
ncbi:leucine-rich repeat domain-containing protein [Streptomyces sp. SID13666]|uniref:STM4015 family protein n=1 Tax=Streptomyces TaxID=1883 RepID=UPI0011059AEB|nr:MULTISPECIES: STM4015 family protein [Streptomyces]MCZ4100178.1 STM4015 family protein [Streptomyces sp. H39-C1]NEA58162.1 leucine-rich repeat domain-containing protein [Streptomyces sp. SID13666]NEA73861.1 leucine-rich repeat domain-containing protein [Streptomyces sp. SID13588]QNA76182.1 leucine-rich repeat domain-containing protein [Streptomyces sp. So13.3]